MNAYKSDHRVDEQMIYHAGDIPEGYAVTVEVRVNGKATLNFGKVVTGPKLPLRAFVNSFIDPFNNGTDISVDLARHGTATPAGQMMSNPSPDAGAPLMIGGDELIDLATAQAAAAIDAARRRGGASSP